MVRAHHFDDLPFRVPDNGTAKRIMILNVDDVGMKLVKDPANLFFREGVDVDVWVKQPGADRSYSFDLNSINLVLIGMAALGESDHFDVMSAPRQACGEIPGKYGLPVKCNVRRFSGDQNAHEDFPSAFTFHFANWSLPELAGSGSAVRPGERTGQRHCAEQSHIFQ